MKHEAKRHSGFTLIEILVAAFVSMIIIGATYMIFFSQQKGFQDVDSHSDKLQGSRMVMDRVTRMLRQAGFSVVAGQVISDAKKYEITFRGDVDADIEVPLAAAVSAGDTQISVDLDDEINTVDIQDYIMLKWGGNWELVPVRTIGGDPYDLTGEPDTIYLGNPVTYDYGVSESLVRTVESVTVAHDYNNKVVTLNGEILAKEVTNLEFHYFNESGTELVPETAQSLPLLDRVNIREVQIIVDMEPTSDTGSSTRYTMSVELRNMERPSIKNDTTPPKAPTGLQIVENGPCGHFTLSWVRPTQNEDDSELVDLAGYKIYYGTSSGSYMQPPYPVSDEALTQVTISDRRLADDTTYYVTMIANDTSFNDSVAAGEISFTLNDEEGPNAPSSPNATASVGEVTLTWGEPAESIDVFGYRIYRGTSPGFNMTSAIVDENTLGPTETSYEDTEVDSCRTYYYKILAVDCANEGTPTDEIYGDGGGSGTDQPTMSVTNTTPPESPAVPPGTVIGASANSANEAVRLYWINPSDADFDGVMVRYSTSSYPANPSSGILLGSYTGNPGQAMNQSHTGLVNGQTYYYSLFAYDRCGNLTSGINVSATPSSGSPMVEVTYPTNGSVISNGSLVFQARAYDQDEYNLSEPPSFESDTGKGITAVQLSINPVPSTQFPMFEYISEYCGFSGNTNPCPSGNISTWCDGTYSAYAVALDNEGESNTSPFVQFTVQNGGLYIDDSYLKNTTGTYKQEVTFQVENTATADLTITGMNIDWDRAYARLSEVEIPNANSVWESHDSPEASGVEITLTGFDRVDLSSGATTEVVLNFIRWFSLLTSGVSIGDTRLYIDSNVELYEVGDTVWLNDGIYTESKEVSAIGTDYLDLTEGMARAFASNTEVSLAETKLNSPMASATITITFDYELDATAAECTTDEFDVTVEEGPLIHSVKQDRPTANTTSSQGVGSINVDNYREVPVHAKVTDNSLQGISSVLLYYNYTETTTSVAPTSGYASLTMTYDETDEWYEATVPYNSDVRAWYYITAEDNLSQDDRDPTTGAYTYDLITDASPPACPTGLTATVASTTSVDLSWNDNSEEDLRGYNIYRSSDCGSYTRVYTLVSDSDSGTAGVQVTDNDVTLDTDTICYTYYITASDLEGNESTSCQTNTQTAGDCPCP